MADSLKTNPFDTKKSLASSKLKPYEQRTWTLTTAETTISWSGPMERVSAIRSGVPFSAIDVISKRINIPIKSTLGILGLPQTTYNKKKVSKSLLDSRDSELVLQISELIDFGVEVFNSEEGKFQAWLQKPNTALGGVKPLDILDTISGINEVRFCLNRIEYGNFA